MRVVDPEQVASVVTSDPTIAAEASRRGYRVKERLSGGWRALSVHYPHVLSAHDLEMYEAIWNLHPGYLPWGRGHFPLVWAIWRGEPAGATLHRMVEKVDAGPIVDQTAVEVTSEDTAFALHGRVRAVERRLFERWWPRLISGGALPERPQPAGGSYHSKADFEGLLAVLPECLGEEERSRLARALWFPGKRGLGGTVAANVSEDEGGAGR